MTKRTARKWIGGTAWTLRLPDKIDAEVEQWYRREISTAPNAVAWFRELADALEQK